MASALEQLLVDEDDLHDDLIASLLARYVSLTTGGGIVFKPEAAKLPVRPKVLIAVLAGMALHRLGKRPSKEALPKEIEALTGIAGGTLRPALRALEKSGLLRSSDGRYDVPAYAIEGVREVLS